MSVGAMSLDEYVEDYFNPAVKRQSNLVTCSVDRPGKQPVLLPTVVHDPNEGDIRRYVELYPDSVLADLRVKPVLLSSINRDLVRSENPREGLLTERVGAYRDAYDTGTAFLPCPVVVEDEGSGPSGEQRISAIDGTFLNREPFANAFFAFVVPSMPSAEKLELYAITNSNCGTPYKPNDKLWLASQLSQTRGEDFAKTCADLGLNRRTALMGECGLLAVGRYPLLKYRGSADSKKKQKSRRALTSIGMRISLLGTGYSGASVKGTKAVLDELSYEEIDLSYSLLSAISLGSGQAARDFFGNIDTPRGRLGLLVSENTKRSLASAAEGRRRSLEDEEATLLSATYLATHGTRVHKLFPNMSYADKEMLRRAHAVLGGAIEGGS